MPDEKSPMKVFICHAHDDKAKARDLYRTLKRRGLQPWLDAEDLLPGQAWQVEIPKALETSDAIIILLSKTSVDKEGYVQKEIKFALDKALEMPEGRIFVIPARLDECEVPRSISGYHWVDLFEEGGYEKLMKSLKLRAAQLERKSLQNLKANEPTPDVAQKPELKSPQIQWSLTDELQDGKPYISIDITSKENRLIKCYCFIKSVELNGVLRDDIKRDISKHTNRISWLGGSDDGVGIKFIDPMGFGKINLASLETNNLLYFLQFETAKGSHSKNRDNGFFPFGNYVITLGLSCAADGGDFWEIPITVGFEYVEQHEYLPNDTHMKGVRATQRTLHLLERSTSIHTDKLLELEKPILFSQDEQKEPKRPPRKLKPEYIIAIIGAAATILAALIGILPQFIKPVSAPTVTKTITSTAKTVFTQIPTAIVNGLPPSQTFTPSLTPEPSLTPTKLYTSTISLTSVPDVYDPHPTADDYHDVFGVPMRLVPAGSFIMGSNNREPNEKPAHLVDVPIFYIDKYEVTNILYKACVDAGVCQPPKQATSWTRSNYYANSEFDNYPVIYVNWNMATSYCEWRNARLPTEAEWEKAARGIDARTYPWGNAIDCTKANYSNCNEDTKPVGSYESGKSPYGVYDLVGNVSEWVNDWYDIYPGGDPNASDDFGQKFRVIRGSDFYQVNTSRSSYRSIYPSIYPSTYPNVYLSLGFRCARDAQP